MRKCLYILPLIAIIFATSINSLDASDSDSSKLEQAAPAQPMPTDYESLVKRYEAEKNLRYSQRTQTISALGRCKDPRALDFLIRCYGSESDQNVKRYIVNAISYTREKKAADFLIGEYDKADENMKQNIAQQLTSTYLVDHVPFDFLKKLISSPSYRIKNSVITGIAQEGSKEAVELILKAYQEYIAQETANKRGKNNNRNTDHYKKRFPESVRKALGSINNKETLKWLATDVLASEKKYHESVLVMIITALGNKKSPEAVPGLIDILERDSDELLEASAIALGEIGDNSSVDPLIKLMKKSDTPKVVAACIGALMRIGDERAIDPILEMAESNKWEIKSVAIRALGAFPCDKALKAAVKALKDKSWQVQLAAVAALKKMRSKDSVEPLIAAMRKAKGRLFHDILDALRDMLEEDWGEDPDEWDDWWKKVKGVFKMPKKEEIAEGEEPTAKQQKRRDISTEVEKPTFFGSEVKSNRVIFIIDISGSMSGSMAQANRNQPRGQNGNRKIDVAKNELMNAVRKLGKKAYFNLFQFHTTYESWQPHMVRATRRSKASALEWINRMQPTGGTNIFDPLEKALQDPNVDTIYLLSDGSPGSGKYTATEDILREIRKINQFKGVKINTVGIRSNKALMEGLAKQNGGEYVEK